MSERVHSRGGEGGSAGTNKNKRQKDDNKRTDGMCTEVVLLLVRPEGPSTQCLIVSGPKSHTLNGIWDQILATRICASGYRARVYQCHHSCSHHCCLADAPRSVIDHDSSHCREKFATCRRKPHALNNR